MMFTTIDEDNDKCEETNCAHTNGGGGWWYNACGFTTPTGLYNGSGGEHGGGLTWDKHRDSDYCYRCHADVGEERPTHRDLPFDSCANVGCHNFHDNRALYEDFLVEHASEPPHHGSPRTPARARHAARGTRCSAQ